MIATAGCTVGLYEQALSGEPCWIRDSRGHRRPAPVQQWLGGPLALTADEEFDQLIASACSGPTLDLGCGPGRLVEHLALRSIPALGIDVSPLAVQLTRQRGGLALRRDIFDPLPSTGRWRHILLADGNIGIGGHPARLLARAAELLAPGGTCLVEVERPGSRGHDGQIRLETRTELSPWIPWSTVGIDETAPVALRAGMILATTLRSRSRNLAVLWKPPLEGVAACPPA
ncbi:methyltransferase domain-containing protein [Lolliginicoccus levis]|uniref:methyltransferase domain-containing protein n=1 Tax=Lolliginicoccus levis TaxID=2919542 RepID=UPI00241D5BA6|nr:class I SAM-dependent methyltransferase [Lolliginicoccus levis]